MNILFSILLFFSINTLNPNPENFSGYILDEETGENLCGVKITVNNDTTYTDFDGHFEIKKCNESTEMKLEMISYETKSIKFSNYKSLTIKRK